MMEHKSPPNWVVGRADCSLDMMFGALHEIVKRDVAAFNELYERKRQGRTFRIIDNTEGCFAKFKVELEKDVEFPPGVLFTLEPSAIRINGGGVQFFARPYWDGERCRLRMNDGDDYEVWEISQEALINLFFGHFEDKSRSGE